MQKSNTICTQTDNNNMDNQTDNNMDTQTVNINMDTQTVNINMDTQTEKQFENYLENDYQGIFSIKKLWLQQFFV